MALGDLTTIDDAKLWLGVTSHVDDTLLTALVSAASGWIVAYTGREYLRATRVETRSGNGGPILMLGEGPVVAITSVVVEGQGDVAGDCVVEGRLLKRRTGVFPRSVGNVVVTYTSGYSPVPPEISQACVDIVADRYRNKGHENQASASVSGESLTYRDWDVPEHVKTVLRQWRRVAVP